MAIEFCHPPGCIGFSIPMNMMGNKLDKYSKIEFDFSLSNLPSSAVIHRGSRQLGRNRRAASLPSSIAMPFVGPWLHRERQQSADSSILLNPITSIPQATRQSSQSVDRMKHRELATISCDHADRTFDKVRRPTSLFQTKKPGANCSPPISTQAESSIKKANISCCPA